jgi:hypothetical protein
MFSSLRNIIESKKTKMLIIVISHSTFLVFGVRSAASLHHVSPAHHIEIGIGSSGHALSHRQISACSLGASYLLAVIIINSVVLTHLLANWKRGGLVGISILILLHIVHSRLLWSLLLPMLLLLLREWWQKGSSSVVLEVSRSRRITERVAV